MSFVLVLFRNFTYGLYQMRLVVDVNPKFSLQNCLCIFPQLHDILPPFSYMHFCFFCISCGPYIPVSLHPLWQTAWIAAQIKVLKKKDFLKNLYKRQKIWYSNHRKNHRSIGFNDYIVIGFLFFLGRVWKLSKWWIFNKFFQNQK